MPMITIGSTRLPDPIRSGPSTKSWFTRITERQMANRYTGNAQTISRTREISPSVTPPKNPATTPINVPARHVIRAAKKPISSEFRPPYSSRAATSRPCGSAPRK